MPVHVVAFAGKPTGSGPSRPLLPVVGDTFFAVQGESSFLLPDNMHLVAAYAVGKGLLRAQIVAPSLLQVGYPFIRPLDNAAATPSSNPNFQVFHEGSLIIPSGEPVSIGVDGTGVSAVALLWFLHQFEQHDQEPQAQDGTHPGTFWLRYTLVANGGAGAIARPNPLTWNQFPILFEQTLPAGTYALVGFEHIGPSAVAARLIFPGSVHRPGTVASTDLGGRTFEGFYEGLFGVYGYFKTISLPYVGVLMAESDEVAHHEGYLRVVRVGDLDHSGVFGHQAGASQARRTTTHMHRGV